MSRQRKLKKKIIHHIPHANWNATKHICVSTDKRGQRTKKLHNKIQIYPKKKYTAQTVGALR